MICFGVVVIVDCGFELECCFVYYVFIVCLWGCICVS